MWGPKPRVEVRKPWPGFVAPAVEALEPLSMRVPDEERRREREGL